MSPAWAALKPPMISEYLTIQDLYSQQSRIYTHNNPGFYTHNNPGFILTTIQDLYSQQFINSHLVHQDQPLQAYQGYPWNPIVGMYVCVCVWVGGGEGRREGEERGKRGGEGRRRGGGEGEERGRRWRIARRKGRGEADKKHHILKNM